MGELDKSNVEKVMEQIKSGVEEVVSKHLSPPEGLSPYPYIQSYHAALRHQLWRYLKTGTAVVEAVGGLPIINAGNNTLDMIYNGHYYKNLRLNPEIDTINEDDSITLQYTMSYDAPTYPINITLQLSPTTDRVEDNHGKGI